MRALFCHFVGPFSPKNRYYPRKLDVKHVKHDFRVLAPTSIYAITA